MPRVACDLKWLLFSISRRFAAHCRMTTKVKNHKVKTLKFSVKATDASKKATTLSLTLKAH